MRIINEILFEFGTRNDSILFQYTGLNKCEREYIECDRWFDQYNSDKLVQQYEWYWTAKYNEIDLKELIPIKVNLKTILKTQPQTIINQEINIFNYNPSPNSIESIDSTLGECYRPLESNHYFDYAVLCITLNNDDKYPIHRYLLPSENYTNYFNETVFVSQNTTQTIIKQSEQFIDKHIGSKIVAL